jgi:histidine ammonia-lyase
MLLESIQMRERNGAAHELEEQDLLIISGADITLQDVIEVSCRGRKIVLSSAEAFVKSVTDSVDVIQRSLKQNIPIYGVNTNFGGMAQTPLSLADLSALQHSLIWGLKCSMGRELPVPCVRAAMLLRCHALSRGASGIRLQLISRFVHFLNSGMTPLLHDIGSLGASGDLIPLSYIAGAITGFNREFSLGLRREPLWYLRFYRPVDCSRPAETAPVSTPALECCLFIDCEKTGA